jgi:hypothetical protein
MADPVVGDLQVRAALDTFQIRRWWRQACPICEERLSYVFPRGGGVYWDSRCACNDHKAPLCERSVGHITRFINSHRAEEAARLWQSLCKSRGKCEDVT